MGHTTSYLPPPITSLIISDAIRTGQANDHHAHGPLVWRTRSSRAHAPALHDDAGDVLDLVQVVQHVLVGGEPALVDEEPVLDARERQREPAPQDPTTGQAATAKGGKGVSLGRSHLPYESSTENVLQDVLHLVFLALV